MWLSKINIEENEQRDQIHISSRLKEKTDFGFMRGFSASWGSN